MKRDQVSKDAIEFCLAYVRFLNGSQNALCGMAKIARSVTEATASEWVGEAARIAARIEMETAGMSCCTVARQTIEWCIRNEVSARDLGEAIATHQRWTGPPVGCSYTELGERIYRRLENPS